MTVKLTYTMDDNVFIILGNIKSVIFKPHIICPVYDVEFTDELHYYFDSDAWILREVW